MDLKTLPTPSACTADFCLIPIGTPTASVSAQIADVQRLLKKSGLKYHMHSAGTTVEGPWDDVFRTIGQAHAMLHAKGVVRIQSDIRAGSRIDKKQTSEDKVRVVEELLKGDNDDEEEPEAESKGTEDLPGIERFRTTASEELRREEAQGSS